MEGAVVEGGRVEGGVVEGGRVVGGVVEQARVLFDYVPEPPGDLPLTEGQVVLQLLTYQLLTIHVRTYLLTD